MKTEEELLERIVINPKIMGGKPIVLGTRITVEQVLKLLAQGLSVKDILKDYPHLTEDDVSAVLLYSAKAVGLVIDHVLENEEEIIKRPKELPAIEEDPAWKTLDSPKHWGFKDSSKRIDESVYGC